MSRPFIVLGDTTSHGGVVVGSTQVTDTHGKRLARVGDQVTCPKRGHGTTVIVTGDPSMIVDGAPVARHGDKCACGAVLISSQMVSTVSDGAGGHAFSAGRSTHGGAFKADHLIAKTTDAQALEQFFEILDASTGKPVENLRYKLAHGGQVLADGLGLVAGRTTAFSMAEYGAPMDLVAWFVQGLQP
jgi:uncharacterized Zn-binding protein involved in type VI secretion